MSPKLLKYLLLLSLVCFIACLQKKLFKDVEVTGRLVNYITKQPLAGISVELRADNVHSSSSYAKAEEIMATTTTDSQGFFVLKSKQSKNHPYYYLRVFEEGTGSNFDSSLFINSSKKDLGNVFFGTYTFNIKLRYLSTSGNCAFVSNSYPVLNLQQGQDTTINFIDTDLAYERYMDIHGSTAIIVVTTNCKNLSPVNTATHTFRLDTADKKTILIEY